LHGHGSGLDNQDSPTQPIQDLREHIAVVRKEVLHRFSNSGEMRLSQELPYTTGLRK
jgi:hypothetical protein